MRIAVATQTGNRVGIGEVSIVGGAFTLSIPQVLNSRWYVGITLYVDRNHNDICETDEHAWDWATRIVVSDMRFDVTPNEGAPSFDLLSAPSTTVGTLARQPSKPTPPCSPGAMTDLS
jgi:hypothetical protein